MNKRNKILQMLSAMFRMCLVFGLLSSSAAMAEVDSSYTLDAGDLLKVSVYGEPDLSFDKIQLNDAGTFSFPFIGTVRAKGQTAAAVERQITQGLKGDYLVNPRVTVSILEYRGFYINGEVRSPGGYPFIPGMTLRKAVALAGGFTERASKRSFNIIHESDANKVPNKANLNTNIMPGDIITIEQSFF
ncbi:polysaccharide biosynthesis/export family protein [Oceanisphaera avium]|uniref:Capsular biosynthesis protein n=1 Tax=Oceanisphaera avium TaxID=1903694 RepID=A0A1Y0D023_9GAMM|nr:polysaccharide biosynthesis/export family protein [Oceanisphaera avium]ART80929.1 capsular biosynthesis protein [Oceanisphaera avium]